MPDLMQPRPRKTGGRAGRDDGTQPAHATDCISKLVDNRTPARRVHVPERRLSGVRKKTAQRL
jgi:hypothetical protein